MAGIIGFVDNEKTLNRLNLKELISVIRNSEEEDEELFFGELGEKRIGLAQTRLSDKSKKTFLTYEYLNVVLDADIYNSQEIQKELMDLNYSFESDGIEEIIIKSFHAWGLKCVDYFIGTFAMAIFDNRDKKVFLCRD